MAGPLISRKRVLAAKVEGTTGTAESLTASEAAFNVFNAEMQPDVPLVGREGQASLSQLTAAIGAYAGTCKFSIELNCASAAVPGWASTFLAACGVGGSALVYTPDSRPPEASSSTAKTITIGAYVDGKKKMLHGCMGNAVFRFRAGQPVMIDFEFKGIWNAVSDVALLAPTYPTTAPLRFISSSLAIGSVNPIVGELTFDLGNEVVLRESSSTSTGYHSAVIVSRAPKVSVDPEAALVAGYDPYGDFLARTERVLSWACASGGHGVAFSAPKAQVGKVSEGNRNGILTDPIEYQLNRSASAGEDEYTITFS